MKQFTGDDFYHWVFNLFFQKKILLIIQKVFSLFFKKKCYTYIKLLFFKKKDAFEHTKSFLVALFFEKSAG